IVTVGPNGGIASIVPSGTTQPIFTGGPSNWSVINTEDEIPPHPEADLEKILRMPEGTTPPPASFYFSFEATQVPLSVSPPISSRPVSQVPAIANQPVTVNLASAVTVPGVPPAAGTTTVTGSLDLWALLNGLTFPGGGVFAWNVHEIVGSSNTTAPSHMTYDSARWQILAFVGLNGTLERVEMQRLTCSGGQWTPSGNKTTSITFTNTYTRDTALEITKTIPDTTDNEFATRSTLFDFTVNLTAHELASLPDPITATIYDSSNNPVSRPITVTVTAATGTTPQTATITFQLRDGERLSMPTLPAGTTFAVTEAAHPEFSASAVVIVGGVTSPPAGTYPSGTPVPNTALTTGSHILTDPGRNAADFTNNHQFVPPTGLTLGNAPFIAAILAVIALALFAATRKRKSIEEMPLG
ncbi:MAG: DUF5979 domain-containing protein, partial [Coriobacteriia bacterium]|nr:DUF5979 domain-containing protein [Coriobacteriia bacterium]MCL2871342.1 DUF5979 domain-containing protein [Coriobacteriia bacterium]